MRESPANSNHESVSLDQPCDCKLVNFLRFIFGLFFIFIFWPVMIVVLLVTSLLTAPFMAAENHQKFGQLILGKVMRSLITSLEFIGIIVVNDQELVKSAEHFEPSIIACNHPALWDAALVLRRYSRLSGIMKAEVALNPLLRTGAVFAGFIPNSPRLKMIRMALNILEKGESILLFPEGTRTVRGCDINPFRPGLSLIAQKANVPVIPVFIKSSCPYLEKGCPLWRMPKLPIYIDIRVGDPVRFNEGEGVRDFTKRLEAVFSEGLQ